MKNIFETLTQLLFVLLGFIVIIFLYLGVTLDFKQITTALFWVRVSIQLVFTIIIFNMVYAMDKRNKMRNRESRYYVAYATNRLKVKYLEKEKLYDKLEEAVKEENAKRLVSRCNYKLGKICTRIKYEDVMTEESPEVLCEKYKVLPRKCKRMIKLIGKIRGGSIKVRELKSKVFLSDKEILRENVEEYDYNVSVYEFKRNSVKTFTFLISTIIAASISYAFVSVNFWAAFINNCTVLLGGAVSGFLDSTRCVKRKTAVYEHRNVFLLRYLNITEEYTPPLPETK